MPNDIPLKQNTEPSIVLLRARSRLYEEARRFQWLQFFLTVLFPFVLGIVGIFNQEIRPATAAITLLITVVDATWLDRQFRRRLAVAARVCERFDCDLFGLPWRPLIAENPVDHEDVVRAAKDWGKWDDRLRDWYPVAVGRAPLDLARFACQRSNLWYDSELRRGYAKWLFSGAWLAVAALGVIGITLKLDFINFIVFMVPAAPVFIWAIREGFRQKDAATANDALKSEVESAIEDFISGDLAEGIAIARAREIQDGIFQRRVASSPLLFPQAYRWRRKGMEHQMKEGADALIRRAGY
jgi:hypothetical protein